MSNNIRSQFQAHPFHLVSPSPWPLFTSGILLSLTTSGVLSMHAFEFAPKIFFLSLICLVYSMSLWFRDIIAEATYLGHHTLAVQRGLNLGVGLFIVSEVFFFLAIFWAFFHSALSPNIEIGTLWPPMGIQAINPLELPLLNTVILLSSGICLKLKYFFIFHFLDFLKILFTLTIVFIYLNDFSLSSNKYIKFLQIAIILTSFSYIFYIINIKLGTEMTHYMSSPKSPNPDLKDSADAAINATANSEITSNTTGDKKEDKSLNLHGHVNIGTAAAAVIADGIRDVGTNIGLAATVSAAIGGATKVIAKTGMPPAQKVGMVLAAGAIGAGIHAGGSYLNRGLASASRANNNVTDNSPIAESSKNSPSNPATPVESTSPPISPISSNNPSGDNTINKFLSDGDSSPLQGLLDSMNLIDFASLIVIYLLVIRLIFFYAAEKPVVFKSNKSFIKTLEYYVNKIIKVNKKVGFLWIWFGVFLLVVSMLSNFYFIYNIYIYLDVLIKSHIPLIKSLNTTTFETINIAIYNLLILNSISIVILFVFSVFLYLEYINKNKRPILIFFTLILLLLFIFLSKYIITDLSDNLDIYVNNYNNVTKFGMLSLLPFNSPRVLSTKRIGPHNYDVLSFLIGSLLGDGSMEKDGKGYRFAFYQKGDHLDYILWLHNFLYLKGYCRSTLPKIQSRIINNQVVYFCRFRTFTYSSFYWIYEGFYGTDKKTIPYWIEEYLSPSSLALWIMDDGCYIKNRGIKLSTNSFTLKDTKRLIYILNTKYNLKCSIHATGAIDQYNIYIPKSNFPSLIPLILPYMHPMFLYKLNLNNK